MNKVIVPNRKGKNSGSGVGSVIGGVAGAIGGAFVGQPGAGYGLGSAAGGQIGGMAAPAEEPQQVPGVQANTAPMQRRLGSGQPEIPHSQVLRDSLVALQNMSKEVQQQYADPLMKGYARAIDQDYTSGRIA